jgi:hypothetical protein
MEKVTATLQAYYDSEERDVATVRLTKATKVASGDSYDEGGTYLQYLRVPRGVDKAELALALRQTMGGSSCTHAYDCCGCASRFIMTKMINTRTMQVRTKIYYNY